MKVNDKEIADFSQGASAIEGRLHHKKIGGNLSQGFKERWFKLRANILYYFNLSDSGQILNQKPAGAIVLEHCMASYESMSETPFCFSLTFRDEVERKHLFSGRSEDYVAQWLMKVKEASYETCRSQLLMLQMTLMSRTGQDPLLMYHRGEGSRLPLQPTTEQSGVTWSKSIKKTSSFQSYVPSSESRQKKESNILDDPGLRFDEHHFDNGLEAIGTSLKSNELHLDNRLEASLKSTTFKEQSALVDNCKPVTSISPRARPRSRGRGTEFGTSIAPIPRPVGGILPHATPIPRPVGAILPHATPIPIGTVPFHGTPIPRPVGAILPHATPIPRPVGAILPHATPIPIGTVPSHGTPIPRPVGAILPHATPIPGLLPPVISTAPKPGPEINIFPPAKPPRAAKVQNQNMTANLIDL